LGSTRYLPLAVSSFQHSYPNTPIYQSTADIYEAAYVNGIDTLLPGEPFDTLVAQGKLPLTALFNSTPPTGTPYDALFAAITPPGASATITASQAALFALGFGSNNLVRNSFREAVLLDALAHPDPLVNPLGAATGSLPTHPLRIDSRMNDLRYYLGSVAPASPVLLCGGFYDPSVFFQLNSEVMHQTLSAQMNPALPNMLLDLEGKSSLGANSPAIAVLQAGFAAAQQAVAAAAPAQGVSPAVAIAALYHGTLVPPFCAAAQSEFFSLF